MCFRNVNYRDLVQLAPEQCERLRITLRALSECDMERSFKLVREYKEEKRLRATFGLAEMERTLSEIWQALLPKRFSRTKLMKKKKNYFTNFTFGHCLNLEKNWKKYFPQYWNAMNDREYYQPFLFESDPNHEILTFKKVLIRSDWDNLTICRFVCESCCMDTKI